MANNIKVIFHGTKAPSGKTTEIEYMTSPERLELLRSSGMFDMEIVGEKSNKPDDTWTIQEIKAHLDSNSIEYLSRDSKSTLLSKL